MGVVIQPAEDPVGCRRITDLFMSSDDRQLRRENQRADLITVLASLPEVPALRFGQRRHGPIVDYQHIGPAQPREQIAEAPVGARQRNPVRVQPGTAFGMIPESRSHSSAFPTQPSPFTSRKNIFLNSTSPIILQYPSADPQRTVGRAQPPFARSPCYT